MRPLMNRCEDERRSKLEQRTQLTAQLETMQEDEQATDEWLAVIRDYAWQNLGFMVIRKYRN